MRFVETSSMWGAAYRRRYYINGRRVSESAFDAEFEAQSMTRKHTREMHNPRAGFYRTVWQFV